ncbi:MAG: hypothetical protein KME27_01355 [Lyngbya sp. HA4199-MV5]|nr:hypothetical protein [Lyngbya sp. HA4199-MV5]
MNTQNGNALPLPFLHKGTVPRKALLKSSVKHQVLGQAVRVQPNGS